MLVNLIVSIIAKPITDVSDKLKTKIKNKKFEEKYILPIHLRCCQAGFTIFFSDKK